jgi:hypothetical protein
VGRGERRVRTTRAPRRAARGREGATHTISRPDERTDKVHLPARRDLVQQPLDVRLGGVQGEGAHRSADVCGLWEGVERGEGSASVPTPICSRGARLCYPCAAAARTATHDEPFPGLVDSREGFPEGARLLFRKVAQFSCCGCRGRHPFDSTHTQGKRWRRVGAGGAVRRMLCAGDVGMAYADAGFVSGERSGRNGFCINFWKNFVVLGSAPTARVSPPRTLESNQIYDWAVHVRRWCATRAAHGVLTL